MGHIQLQLVSNLPENQPNTTNLPAGADYRPPAAPFKNIFDPCQNLKR